MKLSEIYELANRLAPKALSDEMCAKYGFYDNSGILVNTGEDVKGIVFSLDATAGAIDEAIERGANLILTHHPLIYGKISSIDGQSSQLGAKLARCMRKGISVLSMHLNLDSAVGGIDESFMEGILLSAGQTGVAGTRSTAIQLPLNGGGYGRAYDVSSVKLSTLVENIKKTFHTQRAELYGDKEKTVTRAASFCGAGADESGVAFALSQGAEVILSSDFKHHVLSSALESGLAVVTLTHYASEAYGFKKYYEKISRQVKIPCYFHEENALL